MICPNCHYEYVLGVTKCPDCGADLVFKLPPASSQAPKWPKGPKPSTDSVIVFESEIGADIAIAKEILDEASIAYIEGRKANISYNQRKRAIQVGGQDADRARALLSELAQGSRLAEDVDMEESGENLLESNVTVFEPGNQTELSAAKSILNKAGIDYDVIDNRAFSGCTPVEIQVTHAQSDQARALLAELIKQRPSDKQEP